MLSLISPSNMSADVAKCARAMRLAQNLSQRSLAERAGVSQASLKRFEGTGEVAFSTLLQIAAALGCMDDFASLFAARKLATIDEIVQKRRVRGRG